MVDIKARPTTAPMPGSAAAVGGTVRTAALGHLPDISLADVNACLKRSGAARAVHADIRRHVDAGTCLSKQDLEGMLKRAGVETTDVKTVLAYHATENRSAFSSEALHFMAAMDWSDVAAAHVDDLKRQNAEQVQGHRAFIDTDRHEFQAKRSDDGQKLQRTADEKSRLQHKTPFELEADFADETSKSGLQPNSKEAFLLLAHRKRFVTRD